MRAKPFDPLPALGEIVYCRFPESAGIPASKPRPALVVGRVEFDDGTIGVSVAYGTSKRVDELKSGEFAITPQEPAAYKLSGLSFATKFDLRRIESLPYTDEWFRVPPSLPHGQHPKLGTLHPSLMTRARAAFNAVNPPTSA